MDQKLRALTRDHSAARGELEHTPNPIVETLLHPAAGGPNPGLPEPLPGVCCLPAALAIYTAGVACTRGVRDHDAPPSHLSRFSHLHGGGTVSTGKVAAHVGRGGPFATVDDELNTAITPDGQTVYSSKNIRRPRRCDRSVQTGKPGGWSQPQVGPVSGQCNGGCSPFRLHRTRARLFWISNRPVDGKEKEDYDIWIVEKQGNAWGSPVDLPAPINTDAEEFSASVRVEQRGHCTSARLGREAWAGEETSYRAKRQGSGYGAPRGTRR